MPGVKEALNKLERDEHDAIDRCELDWTRGGVANSDIKTAALQKLFTAEADGGHYDIKDWGVFAHRVPILWQLTIQPCLIVDVLPETRDSFIGRLGVTPEQFVELARRRLVVPNVYHFDSDKENQFAEHKRYYKVLEPILDSNHTHCRINAIRRRRFLELLGFDQEEAISEAKRLFTSGLVALDKQSREELTRDERIAGAIVKIAANWAYVVTLGSGNSEAEAWVETTRANPPQNATDMVEVLWGLKARKALIAAPYTAAFGGTHLISPQEIGAILGHYGPTNAIVKRDSNSKVPLTKSALVFREFLVEVGLNRYLLDTPVPDHEAIVPIAPSDREFRNFVSFLSANNSILIRAENLLNEARRVAKTFGNPLKHWTDYFALREELRREQKKAMRNAIVAPSGAAFVAAITTGLAAPHGWTLVAAALGAAGLTAAGTWKGMQSAFEDEGRRKLVGVFGELRDWQKQSSS